MINRSLHFEGLEYQRCTHVSKIGVSILPSFPSLSASFPAFFPALPPSLISSLFSLPSTLSSFPSLVSFSFSGIPYLGGLGSRSGAEPHHQTVLVYSEVKNRPLLSGDRLQCWSGLQTTNLSWQKCWGVWTPIILTVDVPLVCAYCKPLPSNRPHLSYDVCLEVRVEITRTVLCCIVYWSCTQS